MEKHVVKRISAEEHLKMIRRHLVSLKREKRRRRHTHPETYKRKMGPFRIFKCHRCSVVIVTKDFYPPCYKCGKETERVLVPSV